MLDNDAAAVTFDASLFDAHPNSLQLLTYGNRLFNALLDTVPRPSPGSDGRVLRCSTEGSTPVCAYYTLDGKGQLHRIERLIIDSGVFDRATLSPYQAVSFRAHTAGLSICS